MIGNCGVTFAPVKPADHAWLAEMMESVEDIPARSILDGLPFDWESYGGLLDGLERTPKGVNVGGLVGHSAVRYYAMGERSLDERAAPTIADLNVIDFERLALPVPEYFPHGAGRFRQGAFGYDATIVNGRVFMEQGRHSGVPAACYAAEASRGPVVTPRAVRPRMAPCPTPPRPGRRASGSARARCAAA